MVDYAIGDIQGCFEPLMRLLDKINFRPYEDRLWFVGDLVNRGPQSLQVLRFIMNLPIRPQVTLGNHDLHCLGLLSGNQTRYNNEDTLDEIIHASDAHDIANWLRSQAVLIHDPNLRVVMTHAGIPPIWNLATAKAAASELEKILSGDNYQEFLNSMYGNEPNCWSPHLTGMMRLRVICNYFTRMRYCTAEGQLSLEYKGAVAYAPKGIYPWFDVPSRCPLEVDIIFGHWAALEGKTSNPRLHAIDTGCVWGKQLTALRLQDKQRFSVPG